MPTPKYQQRRKGHLPASKSTEMNFNEVDRNSCEMTNVFGVDELPRTGTPSQRALADVVTAAAHKQFS